MTKHDYIMPDLKKAPYHTTNILKWIAYFCSPYKWKITGFFLFRIFRYTVLSLFPLLIGFIINGFEANMVQANPQYYINIIVAYGVLYSICFFNVVFIPESAIFEKAIRAMTIFSIRHINKLSLTWHEEQGSGGKLQRVMTGRKGFQELSRRLRWDVFPLIGGIIAIVVTYFTIDMPSYYLLMYLGFFVSYIFCSWYFARRYFSLYDKFNTKFEGLLSGVYEFVSSIRTVKAFDLGDYVVDRAKTLEAEGQKAVMDAYSVNLFRWTMCNMVAGFWVFLFAGLGFHLVLTGQISAGVYAATFFLALNFWGSCEVIAAILESIYEHANGVFRLTKTLCIQPKQLDFEPYQNVPEKWTNISLDNVTYFYDTKKTQGIKDINLNILRGEKIAFVGNSGAGKSTLVKLLLKQMLPNNGDFKIDDVSVKNVLTGNWLSQIGFVPQDVELFNLTLRQNILIDRDTIKPELLDKVLKQASLYDFIQTLPEGLDTIIGERGIKLSGGQRQRLGIARALIRQAPIMIFDEATSSLDSISESKIQQAIENSFEDRTVFIIAHRLSTVRNVDRIIVIDNGRIIEQGSFKELVDLKGHFATLWSIQSKEKRD